jgi:hypothetical protein
MQMDQEAWITLPLVNSEWGPEIDWLLLYIPIWLTLFLWFAEEPKVSWFQAQRHWRSFVGWRQVQSSLGEVPISYIGRTNGISSRSGL